MFPLLSPSPVPLIPTAPSSHYRFESYAAESLFLVSEADFAIDSLTAWMRPSKVPTPLINKPATCEVVHDAKGVVLVRSH